MICTGHGPVLDTTDSIKTIMQKYEEWSTVVNPNPKKTVIIPYVSAYGYTKELAEKIAEGVKDSGDIDVRSYDMVEADKAAVEPVSYTHLDVYKRQGLNGPIMQS